MEVSKSITVKRYGKESFRLGGLPPVGSLDAAHLGALDGRSYNNGRVPLLRFRVIVVLGAPNCTLAGLMEVFVSSSRVGS